MRAKAIGLFGSQFVVRSSAEQVGKIEGNHLEHLGRGPDSFEGRPYKGRPLTPLLALLGIGRIAFHANPGLGRQRAELLNQSGTGTKEAAHDRSDRHVKN